MCDALIVSKVDYLEGSVFDLAELREGVRLLNPRLRIFEVSAKAGDGMEEWSSWLANEIESVANA